MRPLPISSCTLSVGWARLGEEGGESNTLTALYLYKGYTSMAQENHTEEDPADGAIQAWYAEGTGRTARFCLTTLSAMTSTCVTMILAYVRSTPNSMRDSAVLLPVDYDESQVSREVLTGAVEQGRQTQQQTNSVCWRSRLVCPFPLFEYFTYNDPPPTRLDLEEVVCQLSVKRNRLTRLLDS
jgi:hypothetical protein